MRASMRCCRDRPEPREHRGPFGREGELVAAAVVRVAHPLDQAAPLELLHDQGQARLVEADRGAELQLAGAGIALHQGQDRELPHQHAELQRLGGEVLHDHDLGAADLEARRVGERTEIETGWLDAFSRRRFRRHS